MRCAIVEVIHAVVQLDRFVPVVLAGLRLENIVSGSFGRTFVVWTVKHQAVACGPRELQNHGLGYSKNCCHG
jgi:hypothetical protein